MEGCFEFRSHQGADTISFGTGRAAFNSSHAERSFWAFVPGIDPLTDLEKENRQQILNEVDRVLNVAFSEGLLEQCCLAHEIGILKSKGDSNFGILHYLDEGNRLKKLSLTCTNILRAAEIMFDWKQRGELVKDLSMKQSFFIVSMSTSKY